ncbi:GPN-loop GTPase 2-like isoform X2 [Oscarella lobularis]|uniref:GPN-loop GTPase 2-like isoform X2 n=1 Tax=Oscarella lobularis TaxID=121494 RepID=UPI0033130D44
MFSQIVIGPPGSGKTTYCRAMHEFMTALGRKVAVVNLDPANDHLPYTATVDISHLIKLEDVMEKFRLGPNGGLIYCMEFLEANISWLEAKLAELASQNHYVLFDCPGQVELYTHHNAVRNIVQRLLKSNHRLAAVHLVDSHYCSDPAKFVSVLLTSLTTMIQLELPHVNVLSKVDLIEQCGQLSFGLDFYTNVLDLSFLVDRLHDDPFFSRHKKMNEAICGVIEDYSLVSFITLNIQDKQSVANVVKAVDKANGYVFGAGERQCDDVFSLMSSAFGADFDFFKTSSVKEKYFETEKTE